MKTDATMNSNSLSTDELRDWREIYNKDQAGLFALLPSGKTILASRRGDIITVFDTHLLDKDLIDALISVHHQALSVAAASKFYGEPSVNALARDIRNANTEPRQIIRRTPLESLEL